MLQFTTVAARDPLFGHFLANQVRRHFTCTSVVAKLKKETIVKFEELVNAPDFNDRCENARIDPKSIDAVKLNKQIEHYVVVAGKDKPWSGCERQSIKGLMHALKDRHGLPTVFYTISIDDTHNILSIRLNFPTNKYDGYPSFAGENADENDHIMKMMEALRSGGELEVDSSGKKYACLKQKPAGINASTEISGKTIKFDEGYLQRCVVANATASSVAYHRTIEMVNKLLFKRPFDLKKSVQIFESIDGDLCYTQEAEDKGLTTGILAASLASVGVTENSKRKALHAHFVTWTASSPAFLAQIATNEELWSKMTEALESQIQGEVGVEVHLVRGLSSVLKVRGPRATYYRDSYLEQADPTMSAEVKAVDEGVLTLSSNWHDHKFTCHHGTSGQYGCRFCKEAGHPVTKLEMKQLNAADRIPPGAVLMGDGAPAWCCVQGCSKNWPETNSADAKDADDEFVPMVITKPTASPPFPALSETDLVT